MRRTTTLPFYLMALCSALLFPFLQSRSSVGAVQAAGLQSYPIMFVTQVPVRADFTSIVATFGNHHADVGMAPRGGDLWIRYPDGTTKNLTQAAGYGSSGEFQDHNAIAVRDPYIHWNGTKALFSMVIGSVEKRYTVASYHWQIYEITGFGKGETPVISKLPNQPTNFNNISPIYGTDDRVIFTTDRPRNGQAQLYPQLDEYELAPTNTGMWSLDPVHNDLKILNHAPSGDFTPLIDSYGRLLFTQWDHLQRDQEADGDDENPGTYGTFDYSDESASATRLSTRTEIFPEPRSSRTDLLAGTNLNGHVMNQFFPWQINEDGTEAETLNHIGRHEIGHYIDAVFNDDPNLVYCCDNATRYNPHDLSNFFQIKEDPLNPGRYYGTNAPEFGTHAAGQVVYMDAPPGKTADTIKVIYMTHPETASFIGDSDTPSANNSGHYRDPLPLSDGTLIAAHTSEVRQEGGSGDPNIARYDFQLKTLTLSPNGYYVAGTALVPLPNKKITYWTPDVSVTYDGPLWQLQPVEVRQRTRPATLNASLSPAVKQILQEAGVDEATLRAYLRQNNLALVITQNVTTRDIADHQQPFNLRVPGGVQTSTGVGKVYDVAYMQFFQGVQLRGWGLRQPSDTPNPGRRVLARTMSGTFGLHNDPNSPASSVIIAPDGSAAAFVPAGRATTWQITDPSGVPVVRERYWLTFQSGEIRACGSCHGQNTVSQINQPAPTNPPQALRTLLDQWKGLSNQTPAIFLPVVKH